MVIVAAVIAACQNNKSDSIGSAGRRGPIEQAVAVAAAPPILADTASAAKRAAKPVTYDDAWARCKVHVDTLPRDAHSARYTRGASCMKRFGYRI